MKHLVLLVATLVAGCASPSPDMLGAVRQDIEVEGMRFAVHRQDLEAQVIRRDVAWGIRPEVIARRMVLAAETTSGCQVIPFSLNHQGGPGSAVARVDLRC